jgi:hypothetical protein
MLNNFFSYSNFGDLIATLIFINPAYTRLKIEQRKPSASSCAAEETIEGSN